jgi:hypothetical protein
MVQRRAARYTMNNYHNTSSVNTMIYTLGWPTLAESRLKTQLIIFYKITHCLIAILTEILVPSDNRLRKHLSQSYQHIQISKDTYKWSFLPHTIIQWNMLPQHTVQSTTTYSTINHNIQFNQPQHTVQSTTLDIFRWTVNTNCSLSTTVNQWFQCT